MRIKSQRFSRAMNDELYARARRMRRLEAERRENAYLRVPELKELDSRMKAIALDMGREAMSANDPGEVIALARKLIGQLEEQRERLLEENGFPSDYFEKQYACAKCRDTGRLGSELCGCMQQLAINIAFSDSGINPDESFKNFNLDLQKTPHDRNAMGRLRDAAAEYAERFPHCERHDLLYFGQSGVGKTYLLNCIGGRVLERGFSVLKISAYKLIRMTLDNLKTDPGERPDYLAPDLLMIDDLGTEPMIPNITIETLLSILCERQDQNKANVFATNLDITDNDDGIESIQSLYGERLASRLLAPRTVRIYAVRTSNVRFSV